MSSLLLLAAIVLSLLIGYVVADWQGAKILPRRLRRVYSRFSNTTSRSKDSRYYGVLTKLLNEQPDEALDAFISSLDVNEETLEMHLALGGLLRRRGEFDRAVRVHQNLLERPGLPTDSVHQVQMELARDYARCGLLDRAEALLKELTEVSGVNRGTRWQAGAYLVDIYQDLGEWLAAIDVADQLTDNKFGDNPDFWRRLQAQFSCELAERAFSVSDLDVAAQKLRSALNYDPESTRAYMLRADFALADNDLHSAVVALEHIESVDPSYVPEALSRFEACLDIPAFQKKLEYLQQEHPSLTVLLKLVDTHVSQQNYARAIQVLQVELERIDALSAEQELLQLALASAQSNHAEQHINTVSDFLALKQAYRCEQCGSVQEQMSWLCNHCQSWATVRLGPI